MLLLATSLVGLAAMANAQYITNPTETKMPPIGYTSGEINLADTQTGVFSWDVSAYNPTNYPAWTGTWTRAVAIHVEKGVTGASAANELQVRYSSVGGSAGDTWHVSPTDLSAASTDPTLNLWWCGLVTTGANGLSMNINQALELSVKADCASTQNSCPLGADFKATAWFYQLADTWASAVTYDQTQSGQGIVGGWSDNACFGGTWNNGAGQGWSNSGDIALDVAFHPTDTEGYSANWETLSFNDWMISAGNYVQFYNQPLVEGTEVYPSISQWVERGSAAASDGLYATVRADADALSTQFMLCMSSTAGTGNSIWQAAGNAQYGSGAGQNFAYCDLGCYPNTDCSTTNVPNGGWTMEDYDLTGYGSLWVTTLIVNSAGGSGAAFVTPGHSVAFAWGHPPSAATAFAPSLLLGVLALAAATLA